MKAVNLLPPDQRGSAHAVVAVEAPAPERVGGIGAYVLLGVLALCVACLSVYVLASNRVKDRQAQLAQVTAQVEATKREAAALKPFADFQAVAASRIATVQELAAARFDWDAALRDLSRALPTDVTLSSIVGTLSPNSGAGGGALRGERQSPAIELKGCTTSQPRVAALMARLRNIGGVTRVSLAKSGKVQEAASAPAAGASASGSTIGGGCGKGAPPAFEMVVYFERFAAPASAPAAAPAAGTPAASPAPASAAAPSTAATPAPSDAPAASGAPGTTPTAGAGTP